MGLTSARIALEREARAAPFATVFKASFGLGLASLTTFEVAASLVSAKPSDAAGLAVAGAGLVAGAALALWR